MSNLPRTYAEPKWLEDLDPTGAETASDLESLEQDVMHIIAQTLGSNVADPDKGIGAVNYLSGTSAALAQMPQVLDAQLSNVLRLSGSKTTLTQAADGTWQVQVRCAVGGQVVNFNYALGPGGVVRG
jgi:hypothetical protein